VEETKHPSPFNQPPVPPAPAPEAPAPVPEAAAAEAPEQVGPEVFLAARLRETMAEAANLRTLVAELQTDLARLRAQMDQSEINALDSTYNVGKGSILQRRPDGTYWRIPKSALQQG